MFQLKKKTLILSCDRLDIPSGITEYDEHTAIGCAEDPIASMDAASAKGSARREPRTFPVTVNPLHLPGQRGTGSFLMPSLSNGFVTRVVSPL